MNANDNRSLSWGIIHLLVLESSIKGIDNPKIMILSSFTHPHCKPLWLSIICRRYVDAGNQTGFGSFWLLLYFIVCTMEINAYPLLTLIQLCLTFYYLLKEIFWRMLVTKWFWFPLTPIVFFPPIQWKSMGNRNCLVTSILHNIFLYVPQEERNNNIGVSKWWQNWYFCVNDPF